MYSPSVVGQRWLYSITHNRLRLSLRSKFVRELSGPLDSIHASLPLRRFVKHGPAAGEWGGVRQNYRLETQCVKLLSPNLD